MHKDNDIHTRAQDQAKVFFKEIPSENVGEYYNQIDPAVYEEMLNVINFTEPP